MSYYFSNNEKTYTCSPCILGVLDKIKAGLEYATNYLETAKDIADLVARSLGKKQKERRGEDEQNEKGGFVPSNVMSAFFRMIGLDSQKVTAIVVNSVIFLAQMISSLFELKPPKENIGRDLNDEDDTSNWNPANMIMESKNERIQKLIEQAHNEDLPNQLMERIDGVDAACVRLLLCKTSPVIRAAQYYLKNNVQDESRRMTAWLPSKDKFEENSDQCENTHADCSLFS
ncbi:uncharacterized protein LOC143211057 [Lasioglossum baleicum]|uniref:uncharacterized protein LOC143211057 n=1 Tax=Lasioglossum baleicum TaxID=434251 RepID=UPI003FCEA059